MTRMDHEVRCMALRQLETACHLYKQREYYSVITLAGAANEVFEGFLIDKLFEKLEDSLISRSEDAISQIPEKLQQASDKLINDLKELKKATAQFPKEPEEVWDNRNKQPKSKADKLFVKIRKDCKEIEDICSEFPSNKFCTYLRKVLVHNKLPFDSFSDSVIDIRSQLSNPLEEEDPTEVAIRRRANWIRNTLKHWYPGQPQSVEFDVVEEAKDMLDRAINNYYALTSELTDAMQRFQDMYVRDNKQIRP